MKKYQNVVLFYEGAKTNNKAVLSIDTRLQKVLTDYQ